MSTHTRVHTETGAIFFSLRIVRRRRVGRCSFLLLLLSHTDTAYGSLRARTQASAREEESTNVRLVRWARCHWLACERESSSGTQVHNSQSRDGIPLAGWAHARPEFDRGARSRHAITARFPLALFSEPFSIAMAYRILTSLIDGLCGGASVCCLALSNIILKWVVVEYLLFFWNLGSYVFLLEIVKKLLVLWCQCLLSD